MKTFFYRRKFIFIPFGIAAFLSLISYVVMTLWNYLLPGILHVTAITFWQAMGIFILCKILFGFGKGSHWGRGGSPWMRGNMSERLKNMTPEEKERFKEKMMRHKCNWDMHQRGGFPFDANWDEAEKV
jgi:hypothetical protein